jgi:hypothetical protein
VPTEGHAKCLTVIATHSPFELHMSSAQHLRMPKAFSGVRCATKASVRSFAANANTAMPIALAAQPVIGNRVKT